jgi:DNA-binding transcriptional ArsR family regulator
MAIPTVPAPSRSDPDIASVAAVLGEPARAAMCLALMDDRCRPASELARAANVSAQTASSHLAKLTASRILHVERQGRWRYYRLAGEHAAHAVEALAVLAPPATIARRGDGGKPTELQLARTCYRHLAGRLGVALADALLREQWLAEQDRDYRVTPAGTAALAALGIDVTALRGRGGGGSRGIARRCVDWTERRPHIAGPLGAALADLALARDWVRQRHGSRALRVTPLGRSEFQRAFHFRI